MTEQFTINRRPGYEFLGAITVTIECDPSALSGMKLGLAARVAVKSRAYLSRANLSGADLSGADLSGANLSGAYLSRAYLSGAKINDEPVTRCFARVMRDDGFGFLAFTMEVGGVKIMAGCRWFTVAEFRAHVASKYPDTDKAVETLWIIDAIERRAADLGIALTARTGRQAKRAKKVA